MTTQVFWLNVLSNLIPDFLIGVVIVGAISLLNAQKEKREIEFEERRKKLTKAIGYTFSLRTEVTHIVSSIVDYQEDENANKELILLTPYWDSFVQTGELPTILNINIFAPLSNYYAIIQEAKRIASLIFEAKLFKNDSLREDLESRLDGLLKYSIILANGNHGLVEELLNSFNLSREELDKIQKIFNESNLSYRIQNSFKEKISNDINEKAPRIKEG